MVPRDSRLGRRRPAATFLGIAMRRAATLVAAERAVTAARRYAIAAEEISGCAAMKATRRDRYDATGGTAMPCGASSSCARVVA